MPTLDLARGAPERMAFRHLGVQYQIPVWWGRETGCTVSPVAGEMAMIGVLENVESATRAAMAFMDRTMSSRPHNPR